METKGRSLLSRFAAFRRDESGTATVEAILWIPLLFMMIVFIANVTLMFSAQTRALRIIQDANRAYAVGKLATADAAKTQITNNLKSISANATVTVSVSSGTVTSYVAMPATDLCIKGTVPSFSGLSVTARADQLVES